MRHIFWQCQAFDHIRALHPDACRLYRETWPNCLAECGLCLRNFDLETPPRTNDNEVIDLTSPEPQIADNSPVDVDSLLATETVVDGRVVVWTDGACTDNQHASLRRSGFGAFWAQNHHKNTAEAVQGDEHTNQRAELAAIVHVLESEPRALEIRTDSQYCKKGFDGLVALRARAWRTSVGREVCHLELWQRAAALLDERGWDSVRLVKVKGHASFLDVLHGKTSEQDKYGNDSADRLAVSGAASRSVDPAQRATFVKRLAQTQEVQRLMLEIVLERQRAHYLALLSKQAG